MRRAMSALAFVAALGALGAASEPPPRRAVTFSGRSMGTYVGVTLVTGDSAAASRLAREALAVFARLDSLMSNWTTTSEVARLNREAAVGPTRVHPEVATVLDTSLSVWRASAGTFDITVEPLVRAWGFLGGRPRVPSDVEAAEAFRRVGAQRVHYDRSARTVRFEDAGVRIDLGGIAKGYAVDAAARLLASRGVTEALVNISGNMAARGAPPGSDHWRIGIRDPRDRMPYFARLRLRDEAVSTSGKYEQFVSAEGRTYGHILDPRTGRPAEGLISVTVVAADAFTADTWDTPLFVLGAAEARHLTRTRADIAAVLVAPGPAGVDTVFVERALESRFALEPAARDRFVVIVY